MIGYFICILHLSVHVGVLLYEPMHLALAPSCMGT